MRDYQPQKNNPYILPRTVYNRVLALIRDYERLKEARDEIILGTGEHGMPSGKGYVTSPTESKALRLDAMGDDIGAVERALLRIPDFFRSGVYQNIAHGARFDTSYTHYDTWTRWRRRMIYYVASEKNLV